MAHNQTDRVAADDTQYRAGLAARIEGILKKGGIRQLHLAIDRHQTLNSKYATVFDHPRLVLGFAGKRYHRIIEEGRICERAIGPGEALWTAPQCEMEHHYVADADVLHINLCGGMTLFKPTQFRASVHNPNSQRVYDFRAPHVLSVPGELHASAQLLAAALCDPDALHFPQSYRTGIADALLWHIHQLLISPARVKGGKANLTWRALCAYIEEHYHEPINRESTAKVFRINPNHISRLFSQFCETSFTSYLNSRRLRSAEALLIDSPWLSVKEIAGRCGFACPKHFNRLFRQTRGTTPTAFRAARQAR